MLRGLGVSYTIKNMLCFYRGQRVVAHASVVPFALPVVRVVGSCVRHMPVMTGLHCLQEEKDFFFAALLSDAQCAMEVEEHHRKQQKTTTASPGWSKSVLASS